jgi:3-hydroxyacyl-CoA dehydrogenase
VSSLSAPDEVASVAVVGGGVIGTGWALHYLRMGFDVVMYDPMPAVRDAIPGRVGVHRAAQRISAD